LTDSLVAADCRFIIRDRIIMHKIFGGHGNRCLDLLQDEIVRG